MFHWIKGKGLKLSLRYVLERGVSLSLKFYERILRVLKRRYEQVLGVIKGDMKTFQAGCMKKRYENVLGLLQGGMKWFWRFSSEEGIKSSLDFKKGMKRVLRGLKKMYENVFGVLKRESVREG